MAGDWKELTLDQLGRIVTGKTPSSKGEGYFGGTIPFVTPTDFNGRRIITDTGRYLTVRGAASVAGARIPSRAVMVTCIGSDMGKAAIAGRECVTNQQINSILVGDGNEPLFVYYNLSGRKAEIRSHASGSAQPILNKSGFGALEIALPPLREQQAIACILGALDDKIELNRRMNRTLEEMARAIFKSWFVDFDPVRAKASGQQPQGLKPEIVALFPDSFEDSELGEIPKGWRVRHIGELAEVSSGKRPDARFAERSDEASVPLWGGNGPMAFVRKPLFDEPILLTGRVGTLGSVFRITDPCWPSDNTLVLRASEPSVFQYLFLQLHQVNFASLNRGSTQPLLTQTDLKAQLLVVATKSILETFSRIANSMYCRSDESTAEIRTLAELRDALLPKLISGELRVPDAERIAARRV